MSWQGSHGASPGSPSKTPGLSLQLAERNYLLLPKFNLTASPAAVYCSTAETERAILENHMASIVSSVRALVFCTVFAVCLSITVTAQSTTYNYQGMPYGPPPSCTVKNCEIEWVNIISPTVCPLTGSFTTAQPLAPNLSNAYVSPTAFTFTNCASTINNLNVNSGDTFIVSTNAQGQIVAWYIRIISSSINIPVEGYTTFGTTSYTSTSAAFYSINSAQGGGDGVFYYGGAAGYNADQNLLPGTWTGGNACQVNVQPISQSASPWGGFPTTILVSIGTGTKLQSLGAAAL